MDLLNICWEDILFPKVLQLLTIQDLFNLRSCSMQWKRLIEEYFKGNITHLDSNKFKTETTLKVLFEHCKNVRELRLERLDWLTDPILIPFLDNNAKIRALYIKNCSRITDRSLRPVIYKFKYLQTLYLIDCKWITEGCLDCFMQHQEYIRDFALSGSLCLSDRCRANLCSQYKCQEFGNGNSVMICKPECSLNSLTLDRK